MIPLRYENAEYSDVPQSVRDYFDKIRETRRGLYIHGSVGTGKTHIAYALHKQWRTMSSKGSDFWNTTELLREIKEEFDRGYHDKHHVCERLMESKRLLFLDDIGAEKPTDFVQETFYLLINKHYNDMLPIVFTSNYSLGELSERLGDRTVSRIVELCDVVRLDGADRRLNKKQS